MQARKLAILAAAATGGIGWISTTFGATISFSTPSVVSTTTTNTDLIQAGTVLAAYSFGGLGGNNVAVNGITFSNFTPGTSPHLTFTNTWSSDPNPQGGSNQSVGTPARTLYANNPSYSSILNGDLYDTNANQTITLTGLTFGDTYEVEIWAQDVYARTRYENVSDTSLDSPVKLQYENPTTGGGVGEYTVGTFTADGATQGIEFSADSGTNQINTLLLEDTSVPEPASCALLVLGATALLGRRRRNIA